MEGLLYSNIVSLPKRIGTAVRHAVRKVEGYFFLAYVDHFSRVPSGNAWDSAFGYSAEVEKALTALVRRAHANVLLVGQEGVGSLGVAKEIAHLVHSAKTHKELAGHRVLFVNVEELFGEATPGIHQLHVLSSMISEMERAGNAIVVLSGMGSVFEGRYAVRPEDVLHPFFSSPFMRTITLLTDEEYDAYIAHNKELSSYVEAVPIRGLSAEQTKEFLVHTFGGAVPHGTLHELVDATEHLFVHIPYPKRAIDILEEAKGNEDISLPYITKNISKKVGFDIQRPRDAKLTDIEEVMSASIVNQVHAMREIKGAFMRSSGRGADTKRPIVTMLFTGPVGVGKREAAATIAHTYFGSRNRVVHIDMQSYVGELPRLAREHPFSVLVLEGFEKASSGVQEELLPVLLRGYGTDLYGRDYFTTHMIVIATSNAPAEDTCSKDMLAVFDGVAVFEQLTPAHVREIARRKLARYNGILQMEHGITLDITDQLIEYLAKEGYSEENGASRMDIALQSTVERAVGEIIHKGTFMMGQRVSLDLK